MNLLRVFKKSSNNENNPDKKIIFGYLSFVILIKAVLITIIWYMCFSDPIIKHIDVKAMDSHLLS